MHLFYFDETKYDEAQSPFFFIGGLILHDADLQAHETTLSQIQQNFFGTTILTQQTEMHGKEIFQGKAQFKGRKLADRLKLLEVYFTHSHHSRFLQAADVMLYMASRCESRKPRPEDKFHEKRLQDFWESIKIGTEVKIQRWP